MAKATVALNSQHLPGPFPCASRRTWSLQASVELLSMEFSVELHGKQSWGLATHLANRLTPKCFLGQRAWQTKASVLFPAGLATWQGERQMGVSSSDLGG